jgi:hypothetical protein
MKFKVKGISLVGRLGGQEFRTNLDYIGRVGFKNWPFFGRRGQCLTCFFGRGLDHMPFNDRRGF